MIKSLRDSGFANVGKIHLALTKASGTVSGGTLHSVLGIMDLPAKQKFQMSNPHYLIEGKIESKPARDTVFEWNKDLARWQGYYIMSGVNVKVCLYQLTRLAGRQPLCFSATLWAKLFLL